MAQKNRWICRVFVAMGLFPPIMSGPEGPRLRFRATTGTKSLPPAEAGVNWGQHLRKFSFQQKSEFSRFDPVLYN